MFRSGTFRALFRLEHIFIMFQSEHIATMFRLEHWEASSGLGVWNTGWIVNVSHFCHLSECKPLLFEKLLLFDSHLFTMLGSSVPTRSRRDWDCGIGIGRCPDQRLGRVEPAGFCWAEPMRRARRPAGATREAGG